MPGLLPSSPSALSEGLDHRAQENGQVDLGLVLEVGLEPTISSLLYGAQAQFSFSYDIFVHPPVAEVN